MERLGKSMRKAATRGMQETGDLSVVLAEAMDGRRIIKAYGLEGHSIARVEARLAARLKTLLRAVRLRAAAAPMTDIFAGLVIGAGAVRGGLAESARPAQPQRLYRLSRRPAAGAAAGAQSQPVLARRFRRHGRRQPHVRRRSTQSRNIIDRAGAKRL